MADRFEALYLGSIFNKKKTPPCCPLITIQDSETVTHTGLGTPTDPFVFTAIGGGGGGNPGGSNTQVQFNDSGVFGGVAGFTFNKSTNSLTVLGNLVNTPLASAGNTIIGADSTGTLYSTGIDPASIGGGPSGSYQWIQYNNGVGGFGADNGFKWLFDIGFLEVGDASVHNFAQIGYNSGAGQWAAGATPYGQWQLKNLTTNSVNVNFLSNGNTVFGNNNPFGPDNGNTLQVSGSASIDNILICGGSTTSNASLRIPAGTPPTTPVDGDIWGDGTNLFYQIGGVTKTFTLT